MRISASTATIVRIVYIHSLTETPDYTWEGINLAKWSLVEPAIGITAAAIATLRPLFKNFLVAAPFGKARHTRNMELTSRDSSESAMVVRPGSGRDAAYSREFAAMLGLRDIGVTTTITAGGEMQESLWRRKKRRSVFGEDTSQSNTELDEVRTIEEGSRTLSAVGKRDDEWMGITKTTVITTEQ